MNLIYEQAIKEAKPLPDFTGSDTYFVKLTLNGLVYDQAMLSFVKNTSEELLEKIGNYRYTKYVLKNFSENSI